ncbi:MAG: hypothetical protein E6G41_11260 [Actinobacteria bacterium]|nr:MAG: hypothetical protein E6G41_11260 [Actinomycetota bacterium]
MGTPVTVSAVPSAHPGAGIGTPVPPSSITLDVSFCVGGWPLQALESVEDFAADATAWPPALTSATLLSPCEVWHVPSLEMVPLDSATPASMPLSPPTFACATPKWFDEPLPVVVESTGNTLRHS